MQGRDLLTGGAAAIATVAGGIVAPALAQPAAARTLRFVPHANLASIDPFWTTAWIVRNHAYLVHDQLYGMDERFSIRPQMAEGHRLEDDGLRWTFTLREGLRFHDGEPVRAADFVASIRRRARRDALGQRLTALTAEMKALDDRRFEIRLTKPFPMMLHAFGKVTTPCLFIMPERVAQTTPSSRSPMRRAAGPTASCATNSCRAAARSTSGTRPTSRARTRPA